MSNTSAWRTKRKSARAAKRGLEILSTLKKKGKEMGPGGRKGEEVRVPGEKKSSFLKSRKILRPEDF